MELLILSIEIMFQNDIRIHYNDGSSLFISSERLIQLRMNAKLNSFFKNNKHYCLT